MSVSVTPMSLAFLSKALVRHQTPGNGSFCSVVIPTLVACIQMGQSMVVVKDIQVDYFNRLHAKAT